jgi:hypothetical protein
MEKATPAATATPLSDLDADWFDPLEDAVRGQVRVLIEQLLEEELEAALGRGRYERGPASTRPRPPPCCSGRSWPRVRSPCAGLTAGRPSIAHLPTLTSPPDPDHRASAPAPPISTTFAIRPYAQNLAFCVGEAQAPRSATGKWGISADML